MSLAIFMVAISDCVQKIRRSIPSETPQDQKKAEIQAIIGCTLCLALVKTGLMVGEDVYVLNGDSTIKPFELAKQITDEKCDDQKRNALLAPLGILEHQVIPVKEMDCEGIKIRLPGH